MTSPRRDHLVETARRLFRDRGYTATGIDTILARAGVAKMTLYHHFDSKDQLVLAVLAREDEQWMAWLKSGVAKTRGGPERKLAAVFDRLGQWFKQPGFRGCLFINATAEFPRQDHPVHRMAARHRHRLYEYILELSREAGAADAEALAGQLTLLAQGAIVAAQVGGKGEAAKAAGRAASVLIQASLRNRKPSPL